MPKIFSQRILAGIVLCISVFPFGLPYASGAEISLTGVGQRILYQAQTRSASYPDYEYGYSRRRHHRRHRHYSEHYGSYDCHPVSKYGYDRYGYRIKIGGTMCYDDYGHAYVVPGSRYTIGRY